jgi:hypothetical protein
MSREYRVSTIQDPIANSAYSIYTQSTDANVTLYLTLVNSNNTPAAKETVYTNYGLTYNPTIGNLSIGSSTQISPDRLFYSTSSFYIGNGSTTGITSFSGKIRLGGNGVLSSSGDNVISFNGTNTEFNGNVTVLGNFNAGIVTAIRFVGDGSQLTGIVAGSSYASSAGIATVAQGLTGTPNIIVGFVTATRYFGDGSQLTGISAGSGIATYANVAGIATVSGYATTSGISTVAQGLAGSPNLIVGIVTATSFVGNGSQLTGISTNSPYANVAGIATYADTSGVSTIAGYASSSGIATVSTYSNTSGVSTVSQGLTGTPNLIVGIVTATLFSGDGSQLTGISAGSGIATYANTAGIATYSNTSGISTISGYSNIAGIATYASTSGVSTIAGYASSSGVSTYATTAGIATVSQGLSGSPNLIVGIVTAASFVGNGSQLTGISTNSPYADIAGIATYSNTSGVSTIAGYANTSGISTVSGYSNVAGIATYAATAGIATVSQGLTGSPNIIAGIVTVSALVATTELTLPSGAPGTPTSRDLYAVADTIRYRDSGNVERLILNASDNLANLSNPGIARTNLGITTVATTTPSGALSIQGSSLLMTEGIALTVSNKGETATPSNNYIEKTVNRACTVVGATWELNPTAASTSGSSAAMLFARRSGTKTSLLTANASLPATTGIFTDVSSNLTGTLTLAAGDSTGVDLISVGTGASGLIFTVYVRYS